MRYPKLAVDVTKWQPIDRSEPFGYVDEAGVYSAVLSRPDLMQAYLEAQLDALTSHYECDIYVGYSDERIPPEYIAGIDGLGGLDEVRATNSAHIPRPTLDFVDDAIVDGHWDAFHGDEKPLFHFGPQRFDLALARLQHYTGIAPETMQKYILFTNYAMHVTEFVRFGVRELSNPESRYTGLVLPSGEKVSDTVAVEDLELGSKFQMPRYDLVADNRDGITMINIGVGPSNAKTITDCLAVLRPEAWICLLYTSDAADE